MHLFPHTAMVSISKKEKEKGEKKDKSHPTEYIHNHIPTAVEM
jgi:hypothetical protein